MTKHQYYRDGVEITASEALDHRGLIRDGVTARVRVTMCDGDSRVQFTDGTPDGGGNRPGWRIRVGDTRQAVRDALRDYENDLVNRWRGPNATCPSCQGSGEANDDGECETCRGEGILNPSYETNAEEAYRNTATHHESLLRHRADNRSVSQMVRDHRAHMARLYDARDRELSEAWRQS